MLSNLSWQRGYEPPEGSPSVEIRPAHDGELDNAIRLIISPVSANPDPRQVYEFLQIAQSHRADAGGLWVAAHEQRLVSAVLPIVSPGRTMLLFPPAHIQGQFQRAATAQLIQTICSRAAADGIHLAQVLLDPGDSEVSATVISCSFNRLAELLYMQCPVPHGLRPPSLPQDYHWLTYAPPVHNRFADTILLTYQQSLDCPALNGLRSIDDILAGHKATGQFDPRLWFLLCHRSSPLGALLLSPILRSDALELVYLGLIPSTRRLGISDLLMRQALHSVSTMHHARLSLAVDAGNLPALKLYWRHGLQAIGRKLAFLRDLRAPTLVLGPAIEPLREEGTKEVQGFKGSSSVNFEP
jgi:hypothetical protein